MRRLFLYTAISLTVTSVTCLPVLGQSTETADTISSISTSDAGIMTATETSAIPSLASGIVPPSPQATSLARYAEYPVSHTTGIPDITIPIYTIQMGDFSLPITLSYHASGARIDDIPTCVGMGWTLNAGGAVTRTILGAPDLENATAGSMDYSLYSYSAVKNAVEKNLSNDAEYDKIRGMLDNNPSYDTESDRYTLNAGKWTGVFRYSVADKSFVMLDHNNVSINSYGWGTTSYFTAFCPDNTEYYFKAQECTGVDERQEGYPYVTAWYLTQIDTPWGDVQITYCTAPSLTISKTTETMSAGSMPTTDGDGYAALVDGLRTDKSSYCMTFGQTLPERIEWNCNHIDFNYDKLSNTGLTARLVSITVTDRDGNTLKTVSLDNDSYWMPNGSTLSADSSPGSAGRRLLNGISDSVEGKYTFSYNKSTLFHSCTGSDPGTWSDLFGFYRGVQTSGIVTQTVFSDMLSVFSGNTDAIASKYTPVDRSPVLSATKSGVLEKITFPTGGYVTYDYELNTLGSINVGGLRVKSVTTTCDGVSTKASYNYGGPIECHEHPENIMAYSTFEGIAGMAVNLVILHHMTSGAFPVMSPCQPSNYIAYSFVKETRADGSRVEYLYDGAELGELFGVPLNGKYPSMFDGAIMDYGSRIPLLVRMSVYSSDGTELSRETREYDKTRLRTIDTGVRTKGVYCTYRVSSSLTLPESGEYVNGDRFQYAATRAYVRHASLASVTVTDMTTGFYRTTSYTYDPSLRTTQPKSVSVMKSDGSSLLTEYDYPFDGTDEVSVAMAEEGLVDFPMTVREYSAGGILMRTTDHVYAKYTLGSRGIRYLPYAVYTRFQSGDRILRERITGYNSLARPTGIESEGTGLTSYTWDSTGDRLLSVISPGGLKTYYTHNGLIGLASVTLPNGYATSYEYNSAGLLSSEKDNSGTVRTYAYSIRNHDNSALSGECNSVAAYTWLNAAESGRKEDWQFSDALGRPDLSATVGANTTGKPLYSAVVYDEVGIPSREWLPVIGTTMPGHMTASVRSSHLSGLASLASSTYGDSKAYSDLTHDALGRQTWSQTPGEAWHTAGKGVSTSYVTNEDNDVCMYSVPFNANTLSKDGFYPEKSLSGVRTVDEDGNITAVFSDRVGRKVLERRGTDKKGVCDTYYVYDDLGQLRHVLSPQYQLSGYKDQFGYEYRYDERGNIAKKLLPGCGTTQYWHDRAGRLSFMQDPTLRNAGLYRFYIYDADGRLCIQGTCTGCNRGSGYSLTAVATSAGGGFLSSGYTVANSSSFTGASLEKVVFYDTYTQVTGLNSGLASSSSYSPANGMQTGAVTYASDGTRTMSALYYDIRGNVIEERKVDSSGFVSYTKTSYTYDGQVKESSTADRNLTYSVVNTYGSSSGLLTGMNVTANGSSSSTVWAYDDLGRTVSETRDSSGKGGSVSWSYNLHGQMTGISGTGFSQTLYYTDGPGTAIYNGAVSSMTWTMGTDATMRGYRYTYDTLGRLTEAAYGEGSSLSEHKDRYTEKVPLYSLNSMVRRLQRHGLKDDGIYGKIDNLHITLDGNRVSSVKEDADRVTYPGGMEYDGGQTEQAIKYDDAGNLTSDGGRGITSVTYDMFNRPLKVTFSGGDTSEFVYSADGEKLSVTHSTSVARAVAASGAHLDADSEEEDEDRIMALASTDVDKTEYRGFAVYKDSKPYMLLFRGGYVTFDGGVTFHYYTQDYLGNNRAVVNASSGALEQTVAYYPFGGVIADLGTGHSLQQYKFGGKELYTANGLNEYDLGARRYYQAVPMFTQPDPFAEKFPWLSPYVYCANNPINVVDPDGEIIIFVNGLLAFGRNEGGANYWNGKNSNFVKGAQKYFNDYNTPYFTNIKHNEISTANDRFLEGYHYAKDNLKNLISNLEEGETVKFVTHSMGAAFSVGMASFLYQNDIIVEEMVHINAYQAKDISAHESNKYDTKTIDFQLEDDPVIHFIPGSHNGDIKNSDKKFRMTSGYSIKAKLFDSKILNIHSLPIDSMKDFWDIITK